MNTAGVIDHITGWLADYLAASGAGGFVVGVSGGIDSAVTSSLAARTGRPTVCLEMPIYQSANQVSRAQAHIARLRQRHDNVREQRVELTGVFDALIAALPPAADAAAHERSLVNTRARLRMTTLYYFAALHGYLVAGTGNKVEDFGVGFYTKYGDGGVDLSPIADLIKTEVYQLGAALEVGDDIMQAPPTDGLWGDDRTDEDQLGASYPELEWAMAFSGDDAGLDGREAQVMAIYRRMHAANRHKMEPIPVCQIPDELR